MSHVEIRLAEAKDTEAIIKVVNWAYRGREGVETWTTESHLVTGARVTNEELDSVLKGSSPNNCLFVATIGDQLVGTIQSEIVDKECHLGLFSVDPEYQSKGIGGKLMRHCLEDATSKGCESSVIHVISVRDSLLEWYRKVGFKETGHTTPFLQVLNETSRSSPIVENLVLLELKKPLI